MLKKIEKNITQIGPHSFRVRLMIAGKSASKVWDTLQEARVWRDQHLASAALDVHESTIIESRIKKSSSRTFTFEDAIKDYRTKFSEKKKGRNTEKSRLDRILRLDIAQKPIYMIHRPELLKLLEDIKNGEGQQIKGVKQKSCSEATVKRYYNLIRHIFTICKDNKKIEINPFDELAASDRPKDSRPRDRRLVGDEYERLLGQLSGDSRVILILLVETTMRKGEIFNIEWQNVTLTKPSPRIYLPDSKSGEPRTVPLSTRAVNALKSIQPKGKNDRSGKVFKSGPDALRYQWRQARKNIGSPDLRIHDLRHEGTSRLFERGLNVLEVASITGHKQIQMLKRYTHLQTINLVKKLG